jgi:hypothetical protein
MDESERLQRYKEKHYDSEWAEEVDISLADRIAALLNNPKIDKYCMVDASYYDFSVIPRAIQEKLQLGRDAYLIFGITIEGDLITKWVDRWDLDSIDPIENGICVHPPYDPRENHSVPIEIVQSFNPKLLSTPAPDFIKMFGKQNG